MELEHVRAVVTGAAGGLGREFCLQLVRAGASVSAGDVNTSGLRALRSETAGLPGRLTIQPLDVSEEENVCAFVKTAAADLGEVNTLINCAGVLRDGVLVSRAGHGSRKMNTPVWKRVLDTNLNGTFYLAREVADLMVCRSTQGVIINVSSICHYGNAGQGNYAASKAAINAASRSWALELAPHGIRVAVIAPGLVTTPMLSNISEEALDRLRQSTALRRFGTPHEIWLAVRFAIECEFFTARVLEVDGGIALPAAY
jgi:3-oxoacyl-[acyl-carrier protein] reductase